MKTFLTFLEDTSIVIGGALGLAQIETILGIILLTFQIGLIAWKCGYAIHKHAKNKELHKVAEDLETAIGSLESQINEYKEKSSK